MKLVQFKSCYYFILEILIYKKTNPTIKPINANPVNMPITIKAVLTSHKSCIILLYSFVDR